MSTKVKADELTGARLNAAVATCVGGIVTRWDAEGVAWVTGLMPNQTITCPNYVGCNGYYSTELIERHKIGAVFDPAMGQWVAGKHEVSGPPYQFTKDPQSSLGETAVIACLRYLVKTTLGETFLM